MSLTTETVPPGAYLLATLHGEIGSELTQLPGVRHVQSDRNCICIRLDEPEVPPNQLLEAIRAFLELGLKYSPAWPGISNADQVMRGACTVIAIEEQRDILEELRPPESLPGMFLWTTIKALRRGNRYLP